MYEELNTKDLDNPLVGGIGDNADVDLDALEQGERIEAKHIGNGRDPVSKAIRRDIARDHIAEFPDYYDELEKMEDRLKEKKLKK